MIMENMIDIFINVIKNTTVPKRNIVNSHLLVSFFNIALFFALNNFLRDNIAPMTRIAAKIYELIEGYPPIHFISVMMKLPGFKEYGMNFSVPIYIKKFSA